MILTFAHTHTPNMSIVQCNESSTVLCCTVWLGRPLVPLPVVEFNSAKCIVCDCKLLSRILPLLCCVECITRKGPYRVATAATCTQRQTDTGTGSLPSLWRTKLKSQVLISLMEKNVICTARWHVASLMLLLLCLFVLLFGYHLHWSSPT